MRRVVQLENFAGFLLKGVPLRKQYGGLLWVAPVRRGAGRSDFNPEAPTDRTQMQEVYRRAADQAGKSVGQLAAEGGKIAYLADSASLPTEIPSSNNGHGFALAETVPGFYSMVLQRLRLPTSTPVNDAGSPADFLLTSRNRDPPHSSPRTGRESAADLCAETPPLNYLGQTRKRQQLVGRYCGGLRLLCGEIQKRTGGRPRFVLNAYEGPCSVVTHGKRGRSHRQSHGRGRGLPGRRTIPAGQSPLRVDP
ncbi:MAG: DUF5696 domain-containing protein [Oscillospiraceae bacterium]